MASRSSARVAIWIAATVVAAYSAVVAAPASAAPSGERERRSSSIVIKGDSGFTAANGIRSGTGTKRDPYVISGWQVPSVHISDTSAYFVIEDNSIDRLTLNWNGPRATVINNQVRDLRVNQNVKRTGGPTSGLIAHNRFGLVGQLRHFDGVFAHNVAGTQSSSYPFFSNRAVNFDGFHGARFYDNTLYGYLEVRLHGHHHGSDYAAPSHYHGASGAHGEHGSHGAHGEMVDHSQRYHEVFVYDNVIYSDDNWALVYTDSNHRGNDRTAASETNPALNNPHTHYTKVHLTDNRLVGAGLRIDIFNSKDDRHTETNRGLVEIARNDITLTRSAATEPWIGRDGISVWAAVDLDLRIADNSIAYEPAEDLVTSTVDRFNRDAGIYLSNLDQGDIVIARNSVRDVFYGVQANSMTATVFWRISDLKTSGVTERVYYDSSVRNKPQEGP